MSSLHEIVAKDLAAFAPQASRRSQSADDYWLQLAARAVSTALAQVRTTDELAYALKAASDYSRTIRISSSDIVWREPHPQPESAGRQRTKARKAPAAKRAPSGRKRKRKNP